jgi:hypothetical protein
MSILLEGFSMVRLWNLILASAVGVVVSTYMVSASTVSASEATMNQIIELAKTIDGASAANLYLANLGEACDKTKNYIVKYYFSPRKTFAILLNAIIEEARDVSERELGKYLNDITDTLSVTEANSSAELKSSVCLFVFDKDLRMALEKASATAQKNLMMTMCDVLVLVMCTGPRLARQQFITSFNTYCDSYLAAVRAILTKRFNLQAMVSAATVSASEATMNQIFALAKTIDGASAATMYLAHLGEVNDKRKAYATKYDFLPLLHAICAEGRDASERELGKYLNGITDALSVTEANSSAELKSSVGLFVFDKDLRMALEKASDTVQKNLAMTMCDAITMVLRGDLRPGVAQQFITSFNTYCKNYLAAARAILTKRFNLYVPHCVDPQDYGVSHAVVAK